MKEVIFEIIDKRKIKIIRKFGENIENLFTISDDNQRFEAHNIVIDPVLINRRPINKNPYLRIIPRVILEECYSLTTDGYITLFKDSSLDFLLFIVKYTDCKITPKYKNLIIKEMNK